MGIAQSLKDSLRLPEMIVRGYLEDLSDEELFVRPAESMNHIAWQLGHLIASEHGHVETAFPGSMPELPPGFSERHTKQTASLSGLDYFLRKAEYLDAMQVQREGTLAVLRELTDAQLLQAAPQQIRYLGPTVACVFSGEATHWMMHAGQWAVVRRKLGHPPLF